MANNVPAQAFVATCVATGTPEEPVILPAQAPIVLHTGFLDWVPVPAAAGGAARVSLDTWQMIEAFGTPLSGSRAPADINLTSTKTPLTLALTGAAWTRILNEYVASGLLNTPMASRFELHVALRELIFANPNNLIITSTDWLPVEDFNAVNPVAAVAAQPAQRAVAGRDARRDQPAIPARPALPAVAAVAAVPGRPALHPALEFLTLCSILDLEEGNGTAPWRLISFLAGMLGPCLTQDSRNRLSSQTQFSARALTSGARARYNLAADDNYSLAYVLADFLRVLHCALPYYFLSEGVDAKTLQNEGLDALTYVRDCAGRQSVEEKYIFSFGKE